MCTKSTAVVQLIGVHHEANAADIIAHGVDILERLLAHSAAELVLLGRVHSFALLWQRLLFDQTVKLVCAVSLREALPLAGSLSDSGQRREALALRRPCYAGAAEREAGEAGPPRARCLRCFWRA
jgi:hypothetical protein